MVSWTTKASLVTVGNGVDVSTTAGTKRGSAVGVSVGAIAVKVGMPPGGVGVKYCPHKDMLPTQDAVSKETAIDRPRIRFTIRPLRELYLS